MRFKRTAIWILSLGLIALMAFLLLRSDVAYSPVQASTLVGEWRRVDQPGISLTFEGDGTFSAAAASQRVAGGSYQLLDGTKVILVFDASSPNPMTVTNAVAMRGEKLRVTMADGEREDYVRAE